MMWLCYVVYKSICSNNAQDVNMLDDNAEEKRPITATWSQPCVAKAFSLFSLFRSYSISSFFSISAPTPFPSGATSFPATHFTSHANSLHPVTRTITAWAREKIRQCHFHEPMTL